MTRRARALRYGASIAVALAGVACGAIIPGSAGGTAATVLVGIGLVGIVSLIFYEVGLTEDRERARQAMGDRSPRGAGSAGSRPDGERQNGERQDSQRQDGQRQDGERQDGARHAGEDQTGEHQGGRLRPLDRRRGQRRRLR